MGHTTPDTLFHIIGGSAGCLSPPDVRRVWPSYQVCAHSETESVAAVSLGLLPSPLPVRVYTVGVPFQLR